MTLVAASQRSAVDAIYAQLRQFTVEIFRLNDVSGHLADYVCLLRAQTRWAWLAKQAELEYGSQFLAANSRQPVMDHGGNTRSFGIIA
jgi:hypothetical protein